MLMGIKDHLWTIRRYMGRPSLVYGMDSRMYSGIDFTAIEKELLKYVKKADQLYYYAFSKWGSPDYLFVSKTKIDFNQVDFYSNDGKAFVVEGALYDVDGERFIRFNTSRRSKQIFYEFMIYDSGIPHVVYNRKEYNYTIMYVYNGKYTFEKTDPNLDPVYVSHVTKDNYFIDTYCIRVLFYVVDEVSKMLILKREIHMKDLKENFTLHDVLYRYSKEVSSADYFNAVHPYDNPDFSTEGELALVPSYHLFKDDCLIIKDETGYYDEAGELAIVYLNGCTSGTMIGDFFFGYERTDDHFLKVMYKLNDFDNQTRLIDLVYSRN